MKHDLFLDRVNVKLANLGASVAGIRACLDGDLARRCALVLEGMRDVDAGVARLIDSGDSLFTAYWLHHASLMDEITAKGTLLVNPPPGLDVPGTGSVTLVTRRGDLGGCYGPLVVDKFSSVQAAMVQGAHATFFDTVIVFNDDGLAPEAVAERLMPGTVVILPKPASMHSHWLQFCGKSQLFEPLLAVLRQRFGLSLLNQQENEGVAVTVFGIEAKS